MNWCLTGSFSEQGVLKWWDRERTILGNRSPKEAWDIDKEAVIALAEWLTY